MQKSTLIISTFIASFYLSVMGQTDYKLRQLTAEEERVIVNKGTESAWTGKYTDNKKKGTYHCKWCDAPLYRSTDKFDSHCGWPSFDDEIHDAVKRHPDPDGSRTEIVCSRCGGHLGHVFMAEGFTSKQTRHCVNSISLVFKPENYQKEKMKTEEAIFAGGCFWGVEHFYQRANGVISTKVGYIGGHTTNPTYQEVCEHKTGHAEAIRVTFDPSVTDFETLARLFFEIHDPTQSNRQGPDIGDQYRSEVFYRNGAQKNITEELIRVLEQKGYRVATRVTKASTFWPAEKYHQDYYEKSGGTPYCHAYTKRF